MYLSFDEVCILSHRAWSRKTALPFLRTQKRHCARGYAGTRELGTPRLPAHSHAHIVRLDTHEWRPQLDSVRRQCFSPEQRGWRDSNPRPQGSTPWSHRSALLRRNELLPSTKRPRVRPPFGPRMGRSSVGSSHVLVSHGSQHRNTEGSAEVRNRPRKPGRVHAARGFDSFAFLFAYRPFWRPNGPHMARMDARTK